MTISAFAAFTASMSFAAATIWAGIMDLATLRIRNEIVLSLLGLYAALAPLAGMGAVEIGWSAAAAAGILVCMFVFFSFGWIGGGDAKLASVIALWLGADHALAYVICTALFGGMLTLAILQFRLFTLPAFCLNVPWITRLHASDTGVPYGIAIAAAALFIFPTTPWMTTLA